MARGRKWQRKLRMTVRKYRRRKPPVSVRGREGKRQTQEYTPTQRRRFVQTSVCGGLFVLLVALKLLLPGHLAAFRADLSHWLVKDADFAEAFSAVGRAVGGAEDFAVSLGEAYTAVFGYEEATAVFGERLAAQEREIVALPREDPPKVVREKKNLGFACSSPLLGEVTSTFGWREDPNGGAEAFHYGIDIAAENGTPIACFADGTVGVVGESTVWGNYFTVEHDAGMTTLYAHCESISVHSDEQVSAGQIVATVGKSGNATGPHLHFELRDGGDYLDPMHYVVG